MAENDRSLGVFIMGGTIDSRNAPERDGATVVLDESLVKAYLESLTLNARLEIRTICMKDSRSITPEDRERLMAEIEAVGLCNNLVTHGTYTMQETAKYLHDRRVASSHKVVCLTGGMCTLLGTVGHRGYFMPSDGPFNLGFAMGALPNLEGGIYQAMNGEIFRAPDEWWMHSDKGVSYCKNGKVTELPH